MTLSEREVVATVGGGITVRRLRAWIRDGWVRPGVDGGFDEIDVARVRLVCHLRQHLQVNDEAVPVVLSLMDQVYGLRRGLKTLARAVEAQPEEVRREVARALRDLGGD